MMKEPSYIFLILFCWSTILVGQNSVPVPISNQFTRSGLGNQLLWLEDQTDTMGIEDIQQLPLSQFSRTESRHLNVGFSLFKHWIRVDIVNESVEEKELVLELANPRINQLQFFLQKKDTLLSSKIQGDYFPYSERSIDDRHFLFPIPLPSKEKATCFIAIDKRGENLFVPLLLWNKVAKERNKEINNIFIGFVLGSLMLYLLLLSIYYYSFPSSFIFFYLLFVMSTLLVFIADKGIGFEYIWGAFPDVQQIAMVVAGTLAMISWLLFFDAFFKASSLTFLKACKYLLVSLHLLKTVIAILFLFSFLTFSVDASYLLLVGFNVVNLATIFYLGGMTLWGYLQNKNRESKILTITFCINFFGAITYLLLEKGITPINFFTVNSYILGLFIEIIFISIILFNNYKKEVIQKEQLSQDLLLQKNKAYKNLLLGENRERKRLARELHDGVSIDLTSIIHQLFTLKEKAENISDVNHLSKTVEKVSSDIRNFAHNLQPMELEKWGLVEATEELINKTLKEYHHLEINFLTNIETSLGDTIKQNLYQIVRELLNNTLKHANASVIDIDLYLNGKVLELNFVDNGIGYDEQKSTKGIGLENIKNRVQLLDGKILLQQKPIGGTAYQIQIPIEE